MYPRRLFFSALLALLLLSACSSEKRHLFIVTSCNVLTSRKLDSTFEVTLSQPGVYTRKHEVIVDGKNLSVIQNGNRSRFTIDETGQYVLNLGEDTLLSNPAAYVRELFPGMDINTTIGSQRRNPYQPTGNPSIDTMLVRSGRAREAAERRKEKELRDRGHSGLQTILPGTLARISRNESARLFLLSDAPKQVEVGQGTDIEYYEINTFRYWMNRVQQELEAQSEARYGRPHNW